ncbi:hypothetical protein NPIL_487921 [Nephila pilipes]|uniref:Uncharacterized protein n=1 Tax=Nephila pilipes TaxID=299642 RepID=A0A8X6TIR2_NEPPI|nr:hypothetical protein NPIL_487921 [Nephila pilipes]
MKILFHALCSWCFRAKTFLGEFHIIVKTPLFGISNLKHEKPMLPSSENFRSSENASPQQCGNLSVSLSVPLSCEANFRAKVCSIARHQTQLDYQKEVYD